MDIEQLLAQSKPFIEWALNWQQNQSSVPLSALVQNDPQAVGIVSVDVIEGFCTAGPLSSPRVNRIVAPIVQLLGQAWSAGIRNIALMQDTHPSDAVEFAQYGPHCIRGTSESQTVEAIRALPFFDQIAVIEKNSINSGINTEFGNWIAERPGVNTWIVVGDCTDLCTYQLAMHLRITANESQNRRRRVILPMNCTDTYDLSVTTAQQIGAIPHDGNLLHLIFLYHMMLNGIEVLAEIV